MMNTGISWCGDCRVAEPIIDAEFAKVEGGLVLLYCHIDRKDFKVPSHYFSQYYACHLFLFKMMILQSVYATNVIKLNCVPTLIKWSHGKKFTKLLKK